MIAKLRGEIVEKDVDSVVIDVGGVGYQVYVPEGELLEISVGDSLVLSTYHHVREASEELFGFSSPASKKLFELLISVNGVGPKGALAVMGLGDEKDIRSAIGTKNTAFITGASGIGKKVAERITLDLKDKVGFVGGQDVSSMESGDDATEALVALGYSKAQALEALSKVSSKSIEDRIRDALKELS